MEKSFPDYYEYYENICKSNSHQQGRSMQVSNLTLSVLMDSSFWFDTINLGCSTVYIQGSQVIYSKCKLYFFL